MASIGCVTLPNGRHYMLSDWKNQILRMKMPREVGSDEHCERNMVMIPSSSTVLCETGSYLQMCTVVQLYPCVV